MPSIITSTDKLAELEKAQTDLAIVVLYLQEMKERGDGKAAELLNMIEDA